MKYVMSVSLGSSRRDGSAEICLQGQRCRMERRGTDGDLEEMKRLFQKYAGRVDAFGLGGTDLYICAGGRRYVFRESQKLLRFAAPTPVFDGSRLKATLERRVLEKLQDERVIDMKRSKVFLVSGMDRFGMAETFYRHGSKIVFGDLMVGLSLPVPIRRLSALWLLARAAAPLITRCPVRWLYPMGEAQERRRPRFAAYFQEADIIAGDFHYIRRFMPDNLSGKIIITNTVTAEDQALLRRAGARLLVTTTPILQGRSYGTNLLEAAIYAVSGSSEPISERLIADMGICPGIIHLARA